MKTTASGFSSTAAVLAAALGFGLAGAQRGDAAPAQEAGAGPALTLLSPAPRAAFQGARPVEVSAFYRGTPGNGIVSLELYIDGVRAQAKALDAPEAKGIVSFLIDASLLRPGAHLVVVRATAADAEVSSVRSTFAYGDGGDARPDALDRPAPPADGAAPVLRLLSPAPNGRVQGTIVIRADASDAAGKPPYVSIFVDGEMKQLVNFRPFEYQWDTTALPNGWHTLTVVEAFDNDTLPVAHVKPVQVYVNNPGGATPIRHDLLDAAPAPRKTAVGKVGAGKVAVKTAAPAPLARRPRAAALPVRLNRVAQAAGGSGHGNAPALPSLPSLSLPFTPAAPAAAPKSATPLTGFKPLSSRLLSRKSSETVAAAAARMVQMARAGMPEDGLSSPFLPLTPPVPAVAAAPRPVAVVTPHPAAAAPHTLRLALPAFSLRTPRLDIHLPQLPLHAAAPVRVVTPHAVAPRAVTVRVHSALGAASLLQSAGQSRVEFNRSPLALERPLAAQGSVLFGPLRRIFEAGGGQLQWTARTGTVRAQTGSHDIRMTIGDRTASVNRRLVILDGAPYLSAGRTMVPVSLLGTALDATVQFDPATGHLKITSRH